MRDIHGHESRVNRILKRIKESKEICEENKSILLKYYEYCLAEGLKKGTLRNIFWSLFLAAICLVKPFDKCTKEDLIKLVGSIEQKQYSEWTKHNRKSALKKFFKWLRNSETYPEEVRWIKTGIKNNKSVQPEELLTEDEVKRLINATDNLRDKSFIFVMYESGCRIGELLSLKIKHVQFDEYGAVLLVNGKTGQRRVRLIASAPTLASWLENHPHRGNPEAPLWINIGTVNHNGPIGYDAIKYMLKNVAIRAGITKRVNPHSFRHARATHLAKHLTEFQMNQMFGWKQGSTMPQIYVSLSGRDVDEDLLRLHGFAPEQKKEESMKIQICSRCGEKNDPISSFCRRCATPLDVKIVMQIEEQVKKKDEFAAKVVEAVIRKLNLEKVICETIRELKLAKEFGGEDEED